MDHKRFWTPVALYRYGGNWRELSASTYDLVEARNIAHAKLVCGECVAAGVRDNTDDCWAVREILMTGEWEQPELMKHRIEEIERNVES